MTPFLPLAADLGDIIFLVVVLVGGLVQWLAGRNKKSPHAPESPDPFDPFGGPGDRREGHDAPPRGDGRPDTATDPAWDELMDALGREPRDTPPPIPSVKPATPPPVFVAPEPVRPRLSTPLHEERETPEALPELSGHLKTLLASMEKPTTSAFPGQSLGGNFSNLDQSPTPSAKLASPNLPLPSLSSALHQRGQLRRAIILQEILQPPLALR